VIIIKFILKIYRDVADFILKNLGGNRYIGINDDENKEVINGFGI